VNVEGHKSMRPELANALELARTLPVEELPALLGSLSEITATAQARLLTPSTVPVHDELLTVEECAERMRVSRDWLYRAHRRLPFTRRIGNALRFSANGLDAYLKRAR
jgi:excisionase family DNA binding protein